MISSGVCADGIKIRLPTPQFCLIGRGPALTDISFNLVKLNIKVSCVISQDRENGTRAAEASSCKWKSFEKTDSDMSLEFIKETGATMCISWSAPILSDKFIAAFKGLVFNFHGSACIRGRATASWLILNNIESDRVVLHWVEKGIDTGAEIASEPFEIGSEDYPRDVEAKQKACIPHILYNLQQSIKNDRIPSKQQTARPYAGGLNTLLDGFIDWYDSSINAERVVQAFGWPYPGAGAVLEYPDRKSTRKIRIAKAKPAELGSRFHPKMNGVLIDVSRSGHADVVCGGEVLRIFTVREGENEIPANKTCRLGMRFLQKSYEA